MINEPTLPVQTRLIEPLLKQLEDTVNYLALEWRSCDDPALADQIAEQYQSILRCMIQLGFDSALDVAGELPDRLMPQEYFDLFKQP